MMKNAFQETKKSNFLYYGIILVSVLLEVFMNLAIREANSASLSRFCWLFSLSCTLPSVLIPSCKRSGRWDYLMIWGLFLMFNLLYDSFLGLLFLGLSFGM